jgi:hypothetical protein
LVICVRPPTTVVVNPVSIIAPPVIERPPDREVRPQAGDELVLHPEARLNTLKVVADGVKFVLSGVSSVRS